MPRMYPQMALLRDGRALVVGGLSNWSTAESSAEIYDPGTGVWTPTGPMKWAREAHTATALLNGTVLVAGGWAPAQDCHDYLRLISSASAFGTQCPTGPALRSAEIYDIATGTWSETGTLAGGHTDHAAVRLTSGKVLVIGGAGDSDPSQVEVFDPALAFPVAQLGRSPK
ncbi:MAG: Kelch repeat-containing protein [Gemmatimonadales bacterium]